MICYQCPLCTTPLELQSDAKHYACQQRHHFDLAKAGYLNLLPVQYKHTLEPGDNKQMLAARRAFLEAGHYTPLADAIAQRLLAEPLRKPLRVLDLGCGEGYYSRAIAELAADSMVLDLHGLDIAKVAIAAAAKKQPVARFVVASAQRLPYQDEYFDKILRVFAPSNAQELLRVLKPSGQLLTVTPGPRHLWQLKAFIYAEVKEHAPEPALIEGFELLATEHIHYVINPDPVQRIALLHMTPFAWHANPDVQKAIQASAELEIEVDFCVTLTQKI